MIMPAKEPNSYSKVFTKVLHEAQKYWSEIEYDPAAKTARGTLRKGNRLIIAVLSFDGVEKHLTLTTRLPVNKELDMPTMRQILRYQNNHRNSSAFLTVDEECRIASVWSDSIVYEGKPSTAVDCIFNNTYALLKDDELNELLN